MATVLDHSTLPESTDESAALAAAQELAAPSSNLAAAARRFGDQFPLLRRQRPIRLSGVLVVALMLFYVPWLFTHLNTAIPLAGVAVPARQHPLRRLRDAVGVQRLVHQGDAWPAIRWTGRSPRWRSSSPPGASRFRWC